MMYHFFSDQEDHAKRLQAIKTEGLNETKICCMLAVHLFSQLVPREHVIVDSKMKGIDEFQSCPCKCGRKVITGNTGIGKFRCIFIFNNYIINIFFSV